MSQAFQVQPVPRTKPQPQPEAPRLSKVLCIEDDLHVSHGLQLWLNRYEVQVWHAHFGMQGLSLAISEKPDVIITDICLPQGQGDQLVAMLQEHEETRQIPVIVLTGRKDKALERRMLQLGVKRFLHKPTSWSELENALFEVHQLPKLDPPSSPMRTHLNRRRNPET